MMMTATKMRHQNREHNNTTEQSGDDIKAGLMNALYFLILKMSNIQ